MTLQINYAQVQGAVQDITKAATELENRTTEMETTAQKLMGKGQFEGNAKTAFDQAKTEWNSALAEIKAALPQLGQVSQLAADGIQEADNAAARKFDW